ncbi:MAG: hypothetical protein ACR2MP_22410 [Streptosporangiaceae bacterium]
MQLVPAPVQAAERILDDVLGGLLVLGHDQGQPGQPERVFAVEGSNGQSWIGREPGSPAAGCPGAVSGRHDAGPAR